MKKKIVAMITILSLLLGLLPTVNAQKVEAESSNTKVGRPKTTGKEVIYDCIYFGNYPQSDTLGNTSDPIKWRVLYVDRNDAYLLADKILDIRPYDTASEGEVTWENSEIRAWLNSTFMDKAFSAEEQEAILVTNLENEHKYVGWNNYEYTSGGNDTQDKVFLWDTSTNDTKYGFDLYSRYDDSEYEEDEAPLIFDYAALRSETEYASAGGSYLNRSSGRSTSYSDWWLRSTDYGDPENGNMTWACVSEDDGYQGVYNRCTAVNGICPALHIDLSKTDVWENAGTISLKANRINDNYERPASQATTYDFDVEYIAEKEAKEGELHVEFDETELANSSKEYNHNIAKFCATLSTLAYDISDGYDTALSEMEYNYDSMVMDDDGDSICYGLANKRIELDGNETDVVLVVLRGTYNMEWIDNFDSGTGNTHKGFQRGAEVAFNALKEYADENDIGKNGRDVKVIVTGHSRGGAVANLLGKEILDKGGSFLHDSDDLFDYSFATPNSTSLSERKDSKYNGIFSIVNPEDFVTKVMLSKNWNYGRYGKTYVLPSSSTDSKKWYASYLSKLQDKFNDYRPYDNYKPYTNGMNEVSDYINYVAEAIPNVNSYYNKSLGFNPLSSLGVTTKNTLKNLYTCFLGYYKCNEPAYEKKSKGTILSALDNYYGSVGLKTVTYFVINQALDHKFEWAHLSETYLAAMNSLDKADIIKTRGTKHGIVNCPVDVSICNEDGEVVGQIIDNEIVSDTEGDSVNLSVTGDSKQFWISGDEDYSITLTGNDSGTMDYILTEEDADSGESKRVLYKTVPIQKDMEYSSEVLSDEDISKAKLRDSNGEVVNISEELSGDELGDLSVMVEVEGVGSADSFNNLSYGDSVVLSSVADQNNSFLGWYDSDDNLISEESEYPIIVTENQNYKAKFTNVIVYPESINMENSMTMSIGETRYIEATVLPSNATCSDVIYKSSNENIVSVTEDGIAQAVSNGEVDVTVTSLMDESIQYQCKITVGSTANDSTEVSPTINPTPRPTPKPTVKPTATPKPSSKTAKKPHKVKGVTVRAKKGRKIKVTWYIDYINTSGYQIQYAQNKRFTKNKKKKNVVGWTHGSKMLKGLKKGKTYYVRVRAYNKKYGKKVYGKWSKVKKVKIKK